MKIDEKLLLSAKPEIYLFKEGVFWIAYEQSAYQVSQVKKLKVTKKLVKSVMKEVGSVGFPDSALSSVLPHFKLKEKD